MDRRLLLTGAAWAGTSLALPAVAQDTDGSRPLEPDRLRLTRIADQPWRQSVSRQMFRGRFTSEVDAPDASTSDYRALPARFAATLNSHDIAAFGALFADDYINHQTSAAAPPPPVGKTPKQATIDFFAARLAGIPDLQVTVEAIVASADGVAASFVYTGTHNGPLFGIAPTGRTLRFTV